MWETIIYMQNDFNVTDNENKMSKNDQNKNQKCLHVYC